MSRTTMMTIIILKTFTLLSLSHLAPLAHSYSARSSFTSRPVAVVSFGIPKTGLTMYDSSRDPPSNEKSKNPWTVLSHTEQWISSTLDSVNQGSSSTSATGNNPYARKEVSYVCENASESSMIVAGIFRRLRQAREAGERHGDGELERAEVMGDSYRPSTLRQTQVLVIPNNENLSSSFPVFDAMVQAINQARRNARDYVTDISLERLDNDEDDEDKLWNVAVNCAHLHPSFGTQTAEQMLKDMQKEEDEGEVDLNYLEYQKKKMLARQSPYPTLVLEVRATPPPDFGAAPAPTKQQPAAPSSTSGSVTAADIQRLEALFGQTAHTNHPKSSSSKQSSEEDDLFDNLASFLEEVSSVTPMRLAQDWMAANDPNIPSTAAFTESKTAHVDEAYEFVFNNIAMMVDANLPASAQKTTRQYLVLPHFCSAAATSMEKFRTEVTKIVSTLSELRDKVTLEMFHPEHVDSRMRCPVPVLVLQWHE